MTRSSFGPRRATTWAVTQNSRPMPRVVRLGRAANDNARPSSLLARLFVVAIATVLVVAALVEWRLA